MNKRILAILVFCLITSLGFGLSSPVQAETKTSEDYSSLNLGAWQVVNSPTTVPINGISAVSASDVWAVGANPMSGQPKDSTILHWDGNSWVKVPNPTDVLLSDIDMISSTDGWAVGTCRFLHWNGSIWVQFVSPSCNYISSVKMLSSNEGWAVGFGAIYRWNGSNWSIVYSPSDPWLSSIDMVSSSDGWAVGSSGKIYRWNGTIWSYYNSPTTNGLADVKMVSSNDGWIVGSSGTILHWNGSDWTITTSPSTAGLSSISMISSNDGWIAGSDLLHWNGSAWSQVSKPTTSSMADIEMVSANEGWAVGWDGAIIQYKNEAAANYPIVFVHGFRGFPPEAKIWNCISKRSQRTTNEEADSYFGVADNALASSYRVFYARLLSNPCYTASIDENVRNLIEAIDEAKNATGAKRVIIIAHSMGGIVSRAYLENRQLYRNDVQTLFTFGTPHLGIQLNSIQILANMGLPGFCALYGPGACQLTESAINKFNQDYPSRAPGVKYYTISGDAPFYTLNSIGQQLTKIARGPDDGFVSLYSGTGLWGLGVEHHYTDENHGSFGNKNYSWPYFYFRWNPSPPYNLMSKSYKECLEPILITRTSASCIKTNKPEQTTEIDLAQSTPLETSELSPHSIYTRTIQIEGGQTLFAASWITGTVKLSLIDPSQNTIDPTYATNNQGIVTYTVDNTSANYLFANALPGTWRIILDGSGINDNTPFTTFAAFKSAITIESGLDKSWYTPGETATITTSITSGITSAIITATISLPNGTVEAIQLSPVGSNLYQAVYLIPKVPGYTQGNIQAKGQLSDGKPFDLGASLLFQISPETISLTHIYTEAAQLRSPGSYYFSSLDINVSANVIVSGTYGLSADLVDGNGGFVAHALTVQNLNEGSNSLHLRFYDNDIFASKQDGPYKLTNLLITDRSDGTFVVVEQKDVYSTNSYSYLKFGSGKIFLPIIQR